MNEEYIVACPQRPGGWVPGRLRRAIRRALGEAVVGLLAGVLLLVIAVPAFAPNKPAGQALPDAPSPDTRPLGAPGVRLVAAPTPMAGFRWPLPGAPQPVRRFDPPPQPWAAGHRGVDLAAKPGVVVRASAAGVIRYAGVIAGRPVLSVLHDNGLRTTYEPVQPLVSTGDRVEGGAPIGVLLSGHPGCRVAACLHWGLRDGERYLDPLTLVGLGRVRLLPMVGVPPGTV